MIYFIGIAGYLLAAVVGMLLAGGIFKCLIAVLMNNFC